jgi:uncharacterized SAM-binding protein YcdF (DUF218 family)
MHLSAKDALRITQYIHVTTAEPTQADLAFVFGTRHRDPAYIAADLFARGVVRYVVLTGGQSRVDGAREARAHLDVVLGQGVPRRCVIVEDRSTNTYQNVTMAIPKIVAQIDLVRVQVVVAVAKWYHSRRALMTLKRHFPPGIRYAIITYEPEGFERAIWQCTAQVVGRVLKEWHAIPRYLAQDHIAEISWQNGFYI